MNPIRLISTSYVEILNDLNSDSRTADAPQWLKVIFAGMFAILTIRLNVIANQMFLSTADSRTIVSRLVRWLDYDLKWKSTSSVLLDVVIDPTFTSFSNYTIPKDKLIFTNSDNPPIRFESDQPLTILQGNSTGVVEVFAKETKDVYSIGVTTSESNKNYDLLDVDILTETLQVTVDSVSYTRVDTFAFSNSTSYHFKHEYRLDGTSYIKFGFISDDGVQYGFIPNAGLDIFVQYAVGGGIETNVKAGTITNYQSDDPSFVSCNNPLDARGGSDPESVESAKQNAVLKANTHDMFWNIKSGEYLAKTIQGVYDCKLQIYGFNVTGFILPNGGLVASLGLKTTVANLLYSKAIFSSFNNQNITITFSDANIVNYNITGIAKLNTGISQVNTDRRLKLIVILVTYQYRNAILDFYKENKLTDTINYINTLLSSITSTTYDSNIDGAFIDNLLMNMEYKTSYNYYTDGEITGYVLSNLNKEVKYYQSTIPSGEVIGGATDVFVPIGVTITYA